MSDNGAWRDRFITLSGQADQDKQRHLEAERELLRLITRLCVACQGLDPMLDPHLLRLRNAARDGSEGKLFQQASELGDALVQAQEERTAGDLVQRVLERSALSGQRAKQALRLWRKLAAAPGSASDSQVDELAELLFGGESGAPGKTGLLGRLLNRGAGSSPNQVLRDLIEAMHWPSPLHQQVLQLQQRLGGDAAEDAWVEVVRKLGELAVTAFDRADQDAQAAGRFLEQLSERLQQIDAYVASDTERRRATRESGQQLGSAVSNEVGELSISIAGQSDLDGLRGQVLGALDRIQGHVRTHLEAESQRNEQAHAEAEQMQQQLNDLEQEASDLRRQVAETQQQAMSDALTGLPNRRAFEQRAAQELARWKRFGEPLGLIVWDVDDFKQINDVFGHKAGDRALVLIARILRESLRETDFIARFGGEEFVVLLIGAPPEDALKVAEVMRRNVADAGMHSHKKPIKITLSGGLAMLQEGETVEQLFERADQAMYKAKKAGKNQVQEG